MELSRTSKLVRFAYWLPWPYSRWDLLGKMYIPRSTSLCGFFWRLLLRPGFLFFLVVVVPPLLGILACVAGTGWAMVAFGSRAISREARSIVREYIKAKKDRICPIITIR